MAHFAQLGPNNIVMNVIVVDNDILLDENGEEQEELGIAFCKSLLGEETKWKQTSYNSNFRGEYAGVGDYYSETHDKFYAEKPYPSWILNEDTLRWEPPVPLPNVDLDMYYGAWNEEKLDWDLVEKSVIDGTLE
jgi:hypothetical protein